MSMVNRFIKYLAKEPSETTSPLYTRLNTTDVKTLMGSNVTEVAIYTSQAGELKPPYVFLSKVSRLDGNIGCMSGGNLITEVVRAEVNAKGLDDDSADERAGILLGIVRRAFEQIITDVYANAASLLERDMTAIGGGYEKITGIQILPVASSIPTGGVSDGINATQIGKNYSSKDAVECQLMVYVEP